MTANVTNINSGGTETGAGGRGTSEQRGFDTTLTLIARLEAVALSMIEPVQVTSRVWEWETDTLRTPGVNANSGFVQTGTPGVNFVPTARTVLNNYAQVFVSQIATEGTLRREETNTGDEHEYQVEEKEAIALGRDINQSFIHPLQTKQVATTSGTRIAGSIHAYAANVFNFGSAATAFGQSTVTLTQAAAGAQPTAAFGTFTAWTAAQAASGVAGAAGFATRAVDGTQVPAISGAATAAAFKRSALERILGQVFDQGGKPTNLLMGPQVRSVFTEIVGGRGSANDIYRLNMDSNETVRNSTSYFITDFGFRLRADTEQQMRSGSVDGQYNRLSGLNTPGSYYAGDQDMVAFDPKNVKFGVITPVTRNDDIPQPIYGAASALVAEGTFVFYNPNDLVIAKNIVQDVTNSSAYPNIG